MEQSPEQYAPVDPQHEAANRGVELLNQAVEAMEGQPFSAEVVHKPTIEMARRAGEMQISGFGIRLQLAGAELPAVERYDQASHSHPLDVVMTRDAAAMLITTLIRQGGLTHTVFGRMSLLELTGMSKTIKQIAKEKATQAANALD